MNTSAYTVPEAPPSHQASIEVLPLAKLALDARAASGREKYGVPLCLFNDRDAFIEAAQELLDGAQYIVQGLTERNILALDGYTEQGVTVTLKSYNLEVVVVPVDFMDFQALRSGLGDLGASVHFFPRQHKFAVLGVPATVNAAKLTRKIMDILHGVSQDAQAKP